MTRKRKNMGFEDVFADPTKKTLSMDDIPVEEDFDFGTGQDWMAEGGAASSVGGG